MISVVISKYSKQRKVPSLVEYNKNRRARTKKIQFEHLLNEKNLVDNLKKEIKMLQQEHEEYEEEKEHNTRNKEILGCIYDNGVIYKNGNIK